MKRRDFLKTQSLMLLAASGAIPGLAFYAPRLRAQQGEHSFDGNYFVMIRASNGWDVTLGLDPKAHANGSTQRDMFIEYREDQILNASGLRLGPAAAPLVPHASNIAVINGVFMSNSNVSHDANLDYISTGDGEGKVADLPAEIAHATAAGPFGVVFNRELKRGARTVMPTTVDNIASMATSLDFSILSRFFERTRLHSLFNSAQLTLAQNGQIRDRLLEALKAQEERTKNSSSDNAKRNAAILAAAFASGAAYQGLIDIRENLDTHSAHEGIHLTNQTKVWDAIAEMFSIFKEVQSGDGSGRSLFDRTTFMVVSEFARTPALNASAGKDHNPLTNSVLLAGAGIKGGAAIGTSKLITRKLSQSGDPRHVASPIDYQTGQAPQTIAEARAANFQFIFPENVAATVAEAVGVDRNKFTSAKPDVPALNQVLKG